MQKRAELMKELIMCGRPQGSNLGSPLLICMQCLRAALLVRGPSTGSLNLDRARCLESVLLIYRAVIISSGDPVRPILG